MESHRRDADNITDRQYETLLLKNRACVQCGENFVHRIAHNRRNFKKMEFSFYHLIATNEQYYLHPDCLLDLLKSDRYSGKEKLIIDGSNITEIHLCDRFGENMYKLNYLKKLAGILQKTYEKECGEDFLKSIRVLYTVESDFPRYIYYRFNGDEVEFERIKKKCNKRYASKGVFLDPSVKKTTKALYQNHL